MNARVPEPAVPLDVTDLEDLVCRVNWMSAIAWDALMNYRGHPDDLTKIHHLVRATNELARELYFDFQEVLEGRPA